MLYEPKVCMPRVQITMYSDCLTKSCSHVNVLVLVLIVVKISVKDVDQFEY